MPLAPTMFYDRLPSSSISSSLHLNSASSLYSDDSPSTSSFTSSSFTSRRPPLPRTSVAHFQPRTLPKPKIAVIRPTSSSASSYLSRSPSPISSYSSRVPLHLPLRALRCSESPTPRRVFPQHSAKDDQLDMAEFSSKEQAPVVFDASLNFVMGIDKQKVRQTFKPTASHQDAQTASSYLSTKIANFLQRTDHIMDEWKRIGKGKNDDKNGSTDSLSPYRRRIHRTKSAANIMIKGYQYYSRSSSLSKSPSRATSTTTSRATSTLTDDDKTTQSQYEEVVK